MHYRPSCRLREVYIMIKVFSTGKNEYNCKLSTRYLISIEDKLGENPINALKVNDDEELPKLNPLLIILYYSMRSDKPTLKFEEIYDIYDEYCENGGNIFKLYGFIFELLRDSGLIYSGNNEGDAEPEGEPKN